MGLVLSLDCIPLETKLASIPVWESSAQFACSRLCRVANDQHPEFDSTEEVLLCPTVFSAICQNFEVYPEIDLFASAVQQQLARYCTADTTDAQAEGYNAFNFLWTPGVALYLNPPWSLLAQVVDKILVDGTQGLLVAPHWPETASCMTSSERRTFSQDPTNAHGRSPRLSIAGSFWEHRGSGHNPRSSWR